MTTRNDSTSKILVWDLPVRLFHAMLALSFAGAWLTAESERWRDLHLMLGYTAGALVVLRLAWGIVGTRHARFASFVRGPRRVFGYLRALASGRPEPSVGHNPAGGWAIVALLALTLAVVLTGLAVEADAGPKALEELHEGLAVAMLSAVGLHLLGVFVGSVAHRENLVGAMITGRKRGSPSEAIRRPRRLAAAALLALVVGLWTGLLPAPGLRSLPILTSVTAATPATPYAGSTEDH
jgi:cytochrome b